MASARDILKRLRLYDQVMWLRNHVSYPVVNAVIVVKACPRKAGYALRRGSGPYGLNREERGEHVVLCVATFPGRIELAKYVIDSALSQTFKPDKVLMVLAPGEWGSEKAARKLERWKERNAELFQRGLELVWGEDVRSHNKYRHAFLSYPGSVVVTWDDDLRHAPDQLGKLMARHREHPEAIIAGEMYLLRRDGEELRLVSRHEGGDWQGEMLGGSPIGAFAVLYPPGRMRDPGHHLYDLEEMRELAPRDDDSWLSLHALADGIPYVVMPRKYTRWTSLGGYRTSLERRNVRNGNEYDKLRPIMAERLDVLSKVPALEEPAARGP